MSAIPVSFDVESAEDRKRICCQHCKLVQFVRDSKICLRCQSSYSSTPKPIPVVSVPQNPKPQMLTNAAGYIAVNLKRLREERGYSQHDLADRMGVVRTYVSKIESGSCAPGLKSALRFAEALNVGVWELAGEPDYKRDPFLIEIAALTPLITPAQREEVLDFVRQRSA